MDSSLEPNNIEELGEDNPRPRRLKNDTCGANESATIAVASEELDISRWLLYDLIKQGKVKAEKIAFGKKTYMAVSRAEMNNVKTQLSKKKVRKGLIQRLAAKRRIAKASAWRWLKGRSKKGSGKIFSKKSKEPTPVRSRITDGQGMISYADR